MDGDAYLSYFVSNLVQILPIFDGTEEDNPYIHVQKYEHIIRRLFKEDLCSDRILAKYFPYSLSDSALRWFNSLPHETSFTWLPLQAEFLKTYFSRFLQSLEKHVPIPQKQDPHAELPLKYYRRESMIWLENQKDGAQPNHEELPMKFYRDHPKRFREDPDDGVCINHIGDTMQFSIDDEVMHEDACDDEPVPQFEVHEHIGQTAEILYFHDDEDDASEGASVHAILEPEPCHLSTSDQQPSSTSPQDMCEAIDDDNLFGGPQSHDMTAEAIYSKDEDETSDDDCEMIYIEPELVSPPNLPQQLLSPPEALDQPTDCTIFQGSPSLNIKSTPDSLLLFENPLESYSHRHNFNSLLSFDDYVWSDFIDKQESSHVTDKIYLPFDTGTYFMEVCWVLSDGHKSWSGGNILAEERKEQIEQLPPPLDIRDPPFDHGVFFPVV